MAAYHALVQRLFTQDANVRNVKSFFSVHRAKFETAHRPLPSAALQRFSDHQALQVLAFGESRSSSGGPARRRGAAEIDAVDAGVDAGAGDDLVEQVGADAARAREREQQRRRARSSFSASRLMSL